MSQTAPFICGSCN